MRMCKDMDYVVDGKKIHFGVIVGDWNGNGLENVVFIPASYYGWLLVGWFVKQGYSLKTIENGCVRVVDLSFLSLQDFYVIDQRLQENVGIIVSEEDNEISKWKRAGFKLYHTGRWLDEV